MHSIKFIRDNKQIISDCIKEKKSDVNIDEILDLDLKRRTLIQEVENLKAERNIINNDISVKRKNNDDCSSLIDNMKIISVKIKALDNDLADFNSSLENKLKYIPNIIHKSVPKGSNSKDNKVIKEWGEKPNFSFEPKSHLELAERLNLLDFKRAAKISGTAFPLYIDKGAKLERSLINFMLETHIEKHNYIEIYPPFLVSSNSPYTTGNLPKFKDDMYYIENDDLYCIPTAEVPITNLYSNETLIENDLPKRFVAYSACFRREAGSYGKETKGLQRLHQFNKVELLKFVHPESSYVELDKLLADAEKILQNLNLHYRVIELCSGDLSFSAAKCFDIEVWSPFEKRYLEVSSCSNFESFQSQRGNIKFRNSKTNKLEFVHTLNGSGLATPRLMISILETYQNKDGNINLPDLIKPYFGKDKID
ncbi:MAG: serine--tRNA ligase [Candidatus Pelagibacter sp. TMED166]|nr:MAG: serine--tRNA ligase [Candidatus Pelagibacter sp. TMED166]